MGNSKGRRRRFGAVRELKSSQWQARYRGPDGLMRPADRTFPSKTDAEVRLIAALIYLHSTSERQHTLANAVGELARTQMGQVRKTATDDGASGTKVARQPPRAS